MDEASAQGRIAKGFGSSEQNAIAATEVDGNRGEGNYMHAILLIHHRDCKTCRGTNCLRNAISLQEYGHILIFRPTLRYRDEHTIDLARCYSGKIMPSASPANTFGAAQFQARTEP
jgi:hypothetical protein